MYKQVKFGSKKQDQAVRSGLAGLNAGMSAFLPKTANGGPSSEKVELPKSWNIERGDGSTKRV